MKLSAVVSLLLLILGAASVSPARAQHSDMSCDGVGSAPCVATSLVGGSSGVAIDVGVIGANGGNGGNAANGGNGGNGGLLGGNGGDGGNGGNTGGPGGDGGNGGLLSGNGGNGGNGGLV